MVLEVLTVLKEILERDAKRPYFKPSLETLLKWPCGGIGRRAGLKIQYLHGCGSSILPGATIYVAAASGLRCFRCSGIERFEFMSLRFGDPPQEGPAKGLRCFRCSGIERFGFISLAKCNTQGLLVRTLERQ